jgi:hypothetical protein
MRFLRFLFALAPMNFMNHEFLSPELLWIHLRLLYLYQVRYCTVPGTRIYGTMYLVPVRVPWYHGTIVPWYHGTVPYLVLYRTVPYCTVPGTVPYRTVLLYVPGMLSALPACLRCCLRCAAA